MVTRSRAVDVRGYTARRNRLRTDMRRALHAIATTTANALRMDPSGDALYDALDRIDHHLRRAMRINQLLSEDDVFGEV